MADRQDIDALIVGALYGEIDADERARLDAHLASHPEDRATLEALERTRVQVRRGLAEMPAVEPSPLLSNVLMAAAREAAGVGVKGAVEPPTQSLWSRFVEWMRPVAGHPAFAAAAVLVLVAGTATAMWMRGRGTAAEPQVHDSYARQEVEREKAAATAPAEPARETLGDDRGGDAVAFADENLEGQLAEPTVVEPDPGAPGEDGKDAKAGRNAGAKRDKQAPQKPVTQTGMLVETKGDEIDIKELEEASDDSVATEDGEVDGYRKGEATGAATTATVTRPAAEPPPSDPALEEWAKNAHKRLAKLVGDGKCPEAGRLGADLKDKAPEYYAANVANDRAIRACKSYIEGQAKKKAAKNYKSRSQQNSVDMESPDK